MTELTAEVSSLTIAIDMENDLRDASYAARSLLDRALSSSVERAEEQLAKTQADVDKFKAKYKDHPAGAPLLKPCVPLSSGCRSLDSDA